MNENNILIVDDEESVTKSLRRALMGVNCNIFTASSGKSGLDIIKDNKIKLVISDYRMPEMDGVEFLENIFKTSPEIVRIIMTGYADVSVAISAINRGYVYKFIAKPWDGEVLETIVKGGLEYYDGYFERRELYTELIKKNDILEEINKSLEAKVDERTNQLLYSERMASLGQIACQIGHEINNILSLLMGRLQLADDRKDDSKYIESTLHQFSKLVNRLGIHTKNLLSIGKPIPPDFREIALNDVLDNTISNLLESGVLKYYKIVKEYSDGLPNIYGDSNQIDQIFTNILINAHHAMDKNGELNIALKMSDDEKFIEVHVKDTGKGISKENINRIFEPFFTTKKKGEGTGLGLPVVKKIIETHKGYINVKSELNKGTTMIVGFPLSINRNKSSRLKGVLNEET